MKIRDRTVRSNQIRKISLSLIGISVDRRQGIEAEKNSTAETLVTAIVDAPFTRVHFGNDARKQIQLCKLRSGIRVESAEI